MPDNSSGKLRRDPQATLRIGGVSAIPAVLQSRGLDPDQVLTEAGIDPRLLDDPDNMITYAARGRLVAYCVETTGCQHFGLLAGQRMDVNSLGLIGLLMKSLPNAGSALQSLVSHLHLHSQGGVMALRVEGSIAELTYDVVRSRSPVEAAAQIGDGAVAMMQNVMCTLCGPEFKPVEARFAHRKPENIRPFQRLFGAPLWFDAKQFALVFSPDWLDARLSSTDAESQRLLQKQVDSRESKYSLDLPDQVRDVLRSALLTGHCSLDQIAAIFSMHSWTLSRRLEEFGIGFKGLVDECRFEIAQRMLLDTSMAVSQIAESLGYEQSSSFIRAFRRWSGTTPSRWRATHVRGM